MTKWDKILIVLIIFISLSSIGIIIYIKNQAELLYGIIEVNGVEQEVINLLEVDEPYVIKVENDNNYNIVQVEYGSIRFIESSCPNKDCIRTGKLDAPGEISVCLFSNVSIRVEGFNDDNEELDSTTY